MNWLTKWIQAQRSYAAEGRQLQIDIEETRKEIARLLKKMSTESLPTDLVAPVGQIEPSADARIFAKACDQAFVALTLEGFTERQALAIIGQMIAAANSGGNE